MFRLLVYIEKAGVIKVTYFLRSVNRTELDKGKNSANGGERSEAKKRLIEK